MSKLTLKFASINYDYRVGNTTRINKKRVA